MTFPHIDSSSIHICLPSSVVSSLFYSSILCIPWVSRKGIFFLSQTISWPQRTCFTPRSLSIHVLADRISTAPVACLNLYLAPQLKQNQTKSNKQGFHYLLKTNSWCNVSMVKEAAMINIVHSVFWSFGEWFGSKELNVIELHMEQTNPSVHTSPPARYCLLSLSVLTHHAMWFWLYGKIIIIKRSMEIAYDWMCLFGLYCA